jgi:glycosyltransferase involved in cell wall biosynthesis
MGPLVSIVVPVFNRLHYLRSAIASVLTQTLEDWELLLADDGSGSETLAYLGELETLPQVKVLRLPHCGNPAIVRNVALRHARGEYLAFLDSDDVWAPTKLEIQIASLRSNPERQWGYTGFEMVDATLQPLERRPRFRAAEGWIIRELLSATTTIVQSSVIVRRDLLEVAGPYDEELSWCCDFELWVRLAAHSPADCADRALVLVRRHAEHCCDDLSACEDLVRALDRVRRFTPNSELLSVLRWRRAIACAVLAKSQAMSGRNLSALATVLASAHRSWAYKEWWVTAASATARALTPPAIVSALRRARHHLHRQHL